MRKIEGKRRVSKKELRLTKKSIGTLIKYIALFASMRKKTYQYVSGNLEMAYNTSKNEDVRDCYFDFYRQC